MDQDADDTRLTTLDYCKIGYDFVSMLAISKHLGHQDLRSTIVGNYLRGCKGDTFRLIEAAVIGGRDSTVVDAFLKDYDVVRDRLDRMQERWDSRK